MGIFNAILNRRIGNKKQKEAAEMLVGMVNNKDKPEYIESIKMTNGASNGFYILTLSNEAGDKQYSQVKIYGATDKYAGIIPAYKFGDITLQKEGDTTYAYLNGKKALDYTGVCTDGTDWWFVRDGEVDTYYNGIAGNELGDWFIKDGKVDFTYSGGFTCNSNVYTVDKGKAVKQ